VTTISSLAAASGPAVEASCAEAVPNAIKLTAPAALIRIDLLDMTSPLYIQLPHGQVERLLREIFGGSTLSTAIATGVWRTVAAIMLFGSSPQAITRLTP
jgi:hypothetical protein